MLKHMQRMKKWYFLQILLAILTLFASLGGLFLSDLYSDSDSIIAQAIGQDWVTAFFVIPLFILGLVKSKGGSIHGTIIVIGCQLYLVYSYLLYIFMGNYNMFFLLYTQIVAISFYSLLKFCYNLDFEKLKSNIDPNMPFKMLGWYQILIALTFYFLWMQEILNSLILNYFPAIDMEDQKTIIAMDLCFLLPLIISSAIKVLKRNIIGIFLSGVILIKGITLGLAVICMGIFEYTMNQATFNITWYIFIGITAICTIMIVYYFKHIHPIPK
ncbi:hypothetical protein NEF87_001071 [Candidatus Lokiarchaeum ossiferum]|uniref:Uncharacterized protein n=1 Tax=Candidatus Lokiarchaeum ossiferum TaxID=2951803 RepID=A0ABY6HMP9_9ARCH|nr:hypothetical protein NEF87_001071 [Candidatus Lokiarchaeum sp. B-35]